MDASRPLLSQEEIADHPTSRYRGVIATMPRSGTWYNNVFFQVYLTLVSSKGGLAMQEGGLLKDEIPATCFDIDHLYICHAACPGFDRAEGEVRSRWDELAFSLEGYNRGSAYLTETPGLYDPFENPHVRIIYCYRNPLDQMVSAFHHAQDHVHIEAKTFLMADGTRRPFVDFHDFVFHGALEVYLKQFLTYHWVAPKRPEQVKAVTYETLVRDPLNTFRSMLSFFGHELPDAQREHYLKQALATASMASIKNMERMSGKAIANDQCSANSSHIRGGAIGKWRDYLNREDIDVIERRLNRFELSLDMFTME